MILNEYERTLWDAVLLVIKEADGRYGLKLYGHLGGDLSGFTLTWVDTGGQHFEIPISIETLVPGKLPFVASLIQNLARPNVRDIAENRDKLDRLLRDIPIGGDKSKGRL